jgi:hypothetical protein
MLARVDAAPAAAPLDAEVRGYMAEGAKDDAAIGELMTRLDALGLTRSTLVVVTADHGETLSTAHAAIGLGNMPMRFHHAVGNFEETTRIPIVMALPGVLEGGRAIGDRVRNVDIAPTVLEAEGVEADPRMSGRSMLTLARKAGAEPEARVVVSEGRGSRAVLWDHWRLVVHDTPPRPPPGKDLLDAGLPEPVFEDELYDLAADPGERRNVAHGHPDVVAELKARLAAALANTPTADAVDVPPATSPAVLRMRFAGAGAAHRISGSMTLGDGKHPTTVTVEPAGIAREVLRVLPADHADGARAVLDFAFSTAPEAPVGFDVKIDPPGAAVAWELFLDDAPWPEGRTFAGPFGLRTDAARAGLTTEAARDEAFATSLPSIDPARDLGVFITRDRPGTDAPVTAAGPRTTVESSPPSSTEAAREMQRMLEQWGYAHPSTPKPMASARERE